MKLRFLIGLLGMLILAAWVRLHGLGDQGFFMFDEARYLLEARTMREQIGSLSFTRISDPASFPVVEGMARPLHVMILAAAGSVPTALYCMALFGMASIILVMSIAAKTAKADLDDAGQVASSIAAFLFTFSPSHIFLSRTLLAEVDAVFFLLLGVWLYLDAVRLPRLFCTGLAFGLAIVTQSRMAMSIPFFLVWDIARNRSALRFAWLLVGMLTPVMGMECFYLALRAALHHSGHGESFMTYFEQFLHRSRVDSGVIAFNKPFFGIRYLYFTEQIVVTGSFLASLVMVFHRRLRASGGPQDVGSNLSRSDLSRSVAGARDGAGQACLVATMLALYTFTVIAVASLYDQEHHSGFRWGRSMAPAIPFVIILSAVFLSQVARLPRVGGILITIIVTFALHQRTDVMSEFSMMHSDQQSVLQEAIQRHPAKRYYSEEPLHIEYYCGKEMLPPAFIPRADTLTVVVFDHGYARNFGFYYYLPDTPTALIPRGSHRPSRLMMAEFVGREDLTVEPMNVPDAQIFVLPPADTSPEKLRRIF